MFKPYSPYYEKMNTLIGDLASGGLIDFWIESEIGSSGQKHIEEVIGPQVLTMDHLEIGFKICIVPMILSILAFIAELCIKYFREFFSRDKVVAF